MKYYCKLYLLILIVLFQTTLLNSQDRLNVTSLNNPAPGYINFSELLWGNGTVTLYDNYGFPHYDTNSSIMFGFPNYLSDGNWYLYNSVTDIIHIVSEELQLLDSIVLPDFGDSLKYDSHDMLLLPNGRFIIAMYNERVIDMSQIIDGGREQAEVKGCLLLEIDKNCNIYWRWNSFDHIAITEATDDIDLTQQSIDYVHFNSVIIDKNGDLLVSFRHLDQIVKINKSTGNIIWSLGGSASKSNDFHFTNDDQDGFFGFSHQHSIHILPNENLLLFDNGNLKDPSFSRAVEYQLDQINFVVTKVWENRKSPDVFSQAMGSVQRLDNGNTLINWSNIGITEVKPNGNIALEIMINNFPIFRAIKISNKMDYVYKRITGSGVFQFINQTDTTGIKLDLNSITGYGSTWVEKHNYAPSTETFILEDYSSILPYRWVITSDSVTAMTGKLSINTSILDSVNDPKKLTIFKRDKETIGSFTPLATTYIQNSKELTANFSGLGEFMIVSYILSTPTLISPSNTASGIDIHSRLQWHKLKGATSYRAQISSDINFNNLILNSTISIDTSITYDDLENDKQYYWRVCGMNSKDTSDWSNVWNFRTKIPGTNLLSPVNNQFGVKFTDTLRWTHTGSGSKYWLQLSLDSNFVNVLDNQRNLTNNSFVLNLQDYNKKYFWRVLTSKGVDSSNWSKFNCFTTKMIKPLLLIPSNDSLNLPRSLSLYWSTVSGTNNFNVNICSKRDFTTDSVYIYTATSNQLEVNGLQNSRDYYWKVQAVRTTDSSEFSDIFKFSTLLTSPKLISPAMDSVGLSENILFEWEAISKVDYYKLQVAIDYGFENIVQELTNIGLNRTTIAELPANTQFYWRVIYNYGSQISEYSEIRSFTTGKGPALSIPILSNPINNSLNQKTNGSFEWGTVDNAKFYRIQLSEDSEFSNIVIDSTKIRINSYQYRNFEFEKKYFWRVKALRDYDSSSWSSAWNITTSSKPTLSSITLVEPKYDALQVSVNDTLEWEKVVKAEKYQVQLSLDSLFSILLINSENLITSYYHYTTLEKNRTYYWRVRYITSIDTSDWSSIWEFSTLTEEKLMEPKLLGPDNNIYGMPVTGRLEWESVSGATTYKVRLSKSLAFYPRVLSVSWHKDLELNYSGLEYNTQYYWRVAGQNDESTSDWSDVRSFYTELENPKLLTPINNSIDQPEKGILSWSSIQGANLYSIKICLDSSMQEVLVIDTVDNTTFEYNLDLDQFIYWQVKALNGNNYSSWSEKFTFKTIATSDVDVFENIDLPVSIYPNPFNNSLNLNFKDDIKSPIEIKLFNMLGLLQFQISLAKSELNRKDISIDTMEIPDGLYLISISNGEFHFTEFIIK